MVIPAEHVENLLQGFDTLFIVELGNVAEEIIGVESLLRVVENLSVAGIEAEDQPRTKFVEGVLEVADFVFFVVRLEGFINPVDVLQSRQGN